MDWENIHKRVIAVASKSAELAWEEGEVLLEARRASVWVPLGCGNFVEYVERYLGYKPKWTRERMRVADALTELPLIRTALKEGVVNWSVARELTRVATPR